MLNLLTSETGRKAEVSKLEALRGKSKRLKDFEDLPLFGMSRKGTIHEGKKVHQNLLAMEALSDPKVKSRLQAAILGRGGSKVDLDLDFIRKVDHPAIRVNYDTGNAWYYSKGQIDPVEELGVLAPVVAHVHVKTPKIVDGLLRWVALGDGVLDLPAMARVLKERLPGVPVSYELSPRQRSRDFEPRWRTPEIPPLPELRDTIARSLGALEAVLS